jgi:Co/Zn/Cd efflux system component
MEASPKDISIKDIENSMKTKFHEKIVKIHSSNLWMLNTSKICFSCKIVLNEDLVNLRIKIYKYLKKEYQFERMTIQFQTIDEYQEHENLEFI